MPNKMLGRNGVWDQVQGACDIHRLKEGLARLASVNDLCDGWTALHFVAENTQIDNSTRAQAIQVLVDHGADVNTADEVGWTALHLLCKNVNALQDASHVVACIDLLLRAKAQVNIKTTDSEKTALHFLCENDALTLVSLEALLRSRPDANVSDKDGNTSLHHLAENSVVTSPLLSALLSQKANPNAQNRFLCTPFHSLCQNRKISEEMVQLMIQHGANPSVQNNIGNTPMHCICENPRLNVAMLECFMKSKMVNIAIANAIGKKPFACISSTADKAECVNFASKFGSSMVKHSSSSHQSMSSQVCAEDYSELPTASLQSQLKAWNESLPPLDMETYQSICCDSSFESTYERLQEHSLQVANNSSDRPSIDQWMGSLQQWRVKVMVGFAAQVAPEIWSQCAQRHQRAIPRELLQVQGKVQDVWQRFPHSQDRAQRIGAISGFLG